MRVFSGIQPTGRKHLGNYIGAVRGWVEGQDRADPAIHCIVDLHGTTVAYDPAELRSYVYDTTAILLAAGIDPERSILFRQGDVREHTELTWYLSAVTAQGDLNRMTQFKEKAAKQRDLVSAGLFFYPVLMAADVLAYRAHEVPVGDDQRQHIELMRDIAQRFNARFGDVFVVPEGVIPAVGARIMDLQDPTSKMSTTSSEERGRVYVDDDEKAIRKKIGSAVTDSGSEVRRASDKPGVTNLIDILAAIRGVGPGGRSSASSRASSTGRSRARSPTPSSTTYGRSGSATWSYGPTRPGSRACWPPAPSARASSPRRRCATCASRWASGRPAASFPRYGRSGLRTSAGG